MKPRLWLLIFVLNMPAMCHAGSLYLYTINFDPTPASEATSVSYLSQGLVTSGDDLVPGQVTVISSPGSGATQYPGVGSDFVSPNAFALAFDEGGTLQWLFQGNTNTITGVGTYDFTSTQLSAGLNTYNPSGDVVVQQLPAAPFIYRYTETWNATAVSGPTSYIYDSPVFLAPSFPPDPNAIQLISGPDADAQPYTQGDLFLVGNTLGEGYFVDSTGNSWLMSSIVSPEFDYPGTYGFTSAEVQYYVNNLLETDFTGATGSVSVAVITPEPGAMVLTLIAALFCGLATRVRKQRARAA